MRRGGGGPALRREVGADLGVHLDVGGGEVEAATASCGGRRGAGEAEGRRAARRPGAQSGLEDGDEHGLRQAERLRVVTRPRHRVGHGPEAGRPLRLLPWQKKAYANLLGWVERGTTTRRFRQGSVWVPRGNGKTTVAAPLALYLTFCEAEGGAEGYAAAVTRDQAKILWDTAKNMVARSPAFRAALLGLESDSGLWLEDPAPVEIAGSRLFHARLQLPAAVPTGDYQVEVLLVRSRRVVAIEQLGFIVERTGSAARIAEVAREAPVIYALVCIILAAFAGWLGSVIFRRS